MLYLNAPALIKVRDGITVNLALSVSQSVERGATQYRLKPGIVKAEKREDYEEYKADTISFWFIGDKSLSYRVGEEITEADFGRIEADIKSLQYKNKK